MNVNDQSHALLPEVLPPPPPIVVDDDTAHSLRIKRAKAAERQRRKRERDRQLRYKAQQEFDALVDPALASLAIQSPQSDSEAAQKERAKASARERQRRHRLAVKRRKEGPSEADFAHFSLGSDLPQAIIATKSPTPPPPTKPDKALTFAEALLGGIGCTCDPATHARQHVLGELGMSQQDFESFAPLLAESWDRWDRQRTLGYDPFTSFPDLPATYPIRDTQVPSSEEEDELSATPRKHDSIVTNLEV